MEKPFTFTGAKKIVFGKGSFETIAEQIRALRGSRPFVVIDKNLSASALGEALAGLLGRGSLKPLIFDRVSGEPPLELADEGAKAALKNMCDVVVGIGGGSAMDTAKAVAVIAANKGKAAEYLGLNKIPGPGLPTIMVPTTAGTGSEVTFTAVFVRRNLKKKEGMNSQYLYPDLALLDPLLTVGLPPQTTATTGLDALCHAVESYTSVNASPMSEMFSLEAISLIAGSLRTAVHDGNNIEAREAMLLGSLYAGLGLANAGVTAVHSLSYPLGGRYGVPHGLANTILLPHVMVFNIPGAPQKFTDVAEAMGEVVDGLPPREAAFLAVEAVEALIEDCGIDTTLATLKIPKKDLSELADVALTVARPLANNPRQLSKEDAMEIYSLAY